jgi:hypothetical protein
VIRRPGGRGTGRLEAFSDGVFAITITLLILEIEPPTDYERLLHGLAELWPSYLAYAVTFLFIGQVWANHHVMFDHTLLGAAWPVLGVAVIASFNAFYWIPIRGESSISSA